MRLSHEKHCQQPDPESMARIKHTLLSRLYIFFALAVISYIAVLSLYSLWDQGDLLFLLYGSVAMGIPLWTAYKIQCRPRTFLLVLASGSLAVQIAYVLAVPTLPFSDFGLLYQAAQEVAKGDVSTLHNSPYFQNWAYQTGFVAWMAFWMRIFPVGITFFKITNCLFATGTGCLLYGIIRKYTPETSARGACLLYLLYPGHAFLLPVLTNQPSATCLAVASLYLFFCVKSHPHPLKSQLPFVCAGCVLALANAMRPIAIVIILAVLISAFFQAVPALRQRLVRSLRFLALRVISFAAAFLLVSFLLSSFIKVSTLNPYGLSNNFPQWKFVVGLNQESSGQYNQGDMKIYKMSNRAARAAAAYEIIRERLSVGLPSLLTLAHKKTVMMFACYEASDWAFKEIREKPFDGTAILLGDLENNLLSWSGGFYALSLMATGWGLWKAFRHTSVPPLFVALVSVCVLYVGIHCFIEIQPRYREFMLPALFALAAMALPSPANGQENRRGIENPPLGPNA